MSNNFFSFATVSHTETKTEMGESSNFSIRVESNHSFYYLREKFSQQVCHDTLFSSYLLYTKIKNSATQLEV